MMYSYNSSRPTVFSQHGNSSYSESICPQSWNIGFAPKKASGVGLALVVFFRSDGGCGDIQLAQVAPGERTTGNFFNRHRDAFKTPAVERIVSPDFPASPMSNPEHSFAVNRHTIRNSFVFRYDNHGSSIGNVSRRRVEIIRDDVSGGRVDTPARSSHTGPSPINA